MTKHPMITAPISTLSLPKINATRAVIKSTATLWYHWPYNAFGNLSSSISCKLILFFSSCPDKADDKLESVGSSHDTMSDGRVGNAPTVNKVSGSSAGNGTVLFAVVVVVDCLEDSTLSEGVSCCCDVSCSFSMESIERREGIIKVVGERSRVAKTGVINKLRNSVPNTRAQSVSAAGLCACSFFVCPGWWSDHLVYLSLYLFHCILYQSHYMNTILHSSNDMILLLDIESIHKPGWPALSFHELNIP